MIPKKIHYCWFGGKPLPEDAKRYIESWKKFCPDYEIKEWNENNFDINSYAYTKEAYDARKFAFVTDVVRLHALYTEGGIYMDTDVELIAPIDEFLIHHAFSGFETKDRVPTGLMASEARGVAMSECLADYNEKHFIKEDGSLDLTTNVEYITSNMLSHGLVLNNEYQDIQGYFTMYPSDYFCPKSLKDGKIRITKNTVAIHHFAGSWHTPYDKLKIKIAKIIGPTLTKIVVSAKHWVLGNK